LGFIEKNFTPQYYEDGEDAIVMEKIFKKTTSKNEKSKLPGDQKLQPQKEL